MYTFLTQIRHSSFITYPQPIAQLIPSHTITKSHSHQHATLTIQSFNSGTEARSNGRTDIKEEQRYTGRITPSVQRNIKRKVDLLCQISPTQTVFNPVIGKSQTVSVVFLTLTIPLVDSSVDHKEAYIKLLKPFLRWLREKHGVKSYVWKAELTRKKQIHYHIASNRFMVHSEVKDKWNNLLRNGGYFDHVGNQRHTYNPNSTDIRAPFTSNQVKKYLSKYLSKTDDPDYIIDGKCWDCSQNLKQFKFFTTWLNSHNTQLIQEHSTNGMIKKIEGGYSQIFIVAPQLRKQYLTSGQLSEYEDYLQSIRNWTKSKAKQNPIPPAQTIKQHNSRLSDTLQVATQYELPLIDLYSNRLKSSFGRGRGL